MKRKKLQYKYKIFTYLLILTFVPILILGVYSYRSYVDEVSEKIMMSTDSAVRQVKSKVDMLLDDVKKYYIGKTEEEEIKWLVENNISYRDYSELVRAANVLSGGTLFTDFIRGYTFINFDSNWVFGNYGMFRYHQVTNKTEMEELLTRNQTSLVHSYWNYGEAGGGVKTDFVQRENINYEGLSLILQLPLIKRVPYALLIVNINQETLAKFMQENLGNADITVYDESGVIVYTSNEDIGNYFTSALEKGRDNIEGSERIKIENGKEYAVAIQESDIVGWTYVVSYDWETVRGQAMNIVSITLMLMVCIGMAIALVIFSTNRLYLPVSHLKQRIMPEVPDEEMADIGELDYIANRFDTLLDKNMVMEQVMNIQKHQVLELLQIRLLHGEIKENQLEAVLQKFSIEKKKYFVAIAVSIKSQNNQEIYDEARQDAVRIDVVETMPDFIKEKMMLPPVFNVKAIFCTVTDDDKTILNDKVDGIYHDLDNFVSEKYQFHINFGVSLEKTDMARYRIAYHECLEALKTNSTLQDKNAYMENSSIMFYSDIGTKREVSYYNRILERELQEAVDTGENEKAFEAIDKFIDGLIKDNVSVGESALLLQRFMMAIIMVATDAGLSTGQIFKKNVSSVINGLSQLYDIEKVRAYMKYQVAEPVIRELNNFRASKSSEIIHDIERLVEEKEGDITLTECAEHLNYHPTYIWKVMKMEKNKTFSDYISEYRVSRAKALLLETDLTVSEIATKMNYTNSQNFIRFFSKMEGGITPGKYRQMHKKS